MLLIAWFGLGHGALCSLEGCELCCSQVLLPVVIIILQFMQTLNCCRNLSVGCSGGTCILYF